MFWLKGVWKTCCIAITMTQVCFLAIKRFFFFSYFWSSYMVYWYVFPLFTYVDPRYIEHLSQRRYCPISLKHLLPECCFFFTKRRDELCALSKSFLQDVCLSQPGPHLAKIVRARLSFFYDFFNWKQLSLVKKALE